MKVLVTGGAGFVGSHTADALLAKGHEVRVFDSLEPQVHGENPTIPAYLNPEVEFIWGDVRDRDALKKAVAGVDAIFHLAAAVGVGQSMYEVYKYVEVNSLGGAVLLDILANDKHKVQKVVVASSMSIYGEGQYRCVNCGIVYPKLRSEAQLEEQKWEMRCPHCDGVAIPMPTGEDKPLFPTSIYAISKRDHEEMFLTVGWTYGIPTVALRYFNIYGPRQALSNPYTGVAAIFSSRLLNHNPPLVFEDGLQSRDFIHVSDIVQASMLALEKEEANYEVFNVGTGRQLTILDMGNILCEELDPEQKPVILNQYRAGDIRHCYADISRIREKLGFAPKVAFEDGINGLVDWVRTQQADDLVEKAKAQLLERRLVK
jgi:dTDP-L-rhamnose 4-epimerase